MGKVVVTITVGLMTVLVAYLISRLDSISLEVKVVTNPSRIRADGRVTEPSMPQSDPYVQGILDEAQHH